MGPVIYKLICARVLGDVRRAWSFVLENTTNYDTAATCSNSPRCSQGGRSGCSSPCLVPQAPGALQVVIRAPARCHRGGRACLCVTGRSIRRSRKLFEESVPCYLTMLHFTLCMDMHGVTLVHIYIYIYIYRGEGLSLRGMLSLGAWRMGLGCSGKILPPPSSSPPSPRLRVAGKLRVA
jgi:hypothetical protein